MKKLTLAFVLALMAIPLSITSAMDTAERSKFFNYHFEALTTSPDYNATILKGFNKLDRGNFFEPTVFDNSGENKIFKPNVGDIDVNFPAVTRCLHWKSCVNRSYNVGRLQDRYEKQRITHGGWDKYDKAVYQNESVIDAAKARHNQRNQYLNESRSGFMKLLLLKEAGY